MTSQAQIHHKATETREMVSRLADKHALVPICGVLRASVAKIRAKQSQFAEDRMRVNRRQPKGLGEKDVDYGSAKTKPIWTESFKFEV